jgi:hypothetical protein
MRHIKNSDKDGIFILVHPGVPNSTTTEYGEPITEGSICIDYTYKDLYILKNGTWQKYGVGFDGNAYIPLDGTAFNKPVTGDIEFANGISTYSGTSRITHYQNNVNIDSNYKRLNIGDNIIYSTKNTPLIDSNSRSNIITSLLSSGLTMSDSHNNKMFVTLDVQNAIMANNTNNTFTGRINGGILQFIGNNTNSFNLNFNDISSTDTIDISNNYNSDISILNINTGFDTVILNNNSLYTNIASLTNSLINGVNNSYICGILIDTQILNSNNLNSNVQLINTDITNSTYTNIFGGIIGNSNIQLSVHNNIFSTSNLLNINDVRYSTIFGSVSNMTLNDIENNIIFNADGYTITGIGLGSGSDYNTVLQSKSTATSFIKGNNNFLSNIKNINKTSNIEEFNYNIAFYVDSIVFDGLSTAATSNIVISKGFNSTVGSNNLIIHNGTNNNVFGDYNFLYGDITIPGGVNVNDGNIILGANTLNSTITSNNIILGAKNLTGINHNSQDENIFLNVDNFVADSNRTVYLPNTINMVNNGYIAKFNANNISQNNTYYLPNNSGTIALLSDIGTGSDPDAIKKDGTTITTAAIPFAEGITIANNKFIKDTTGNASLKLNDTQSELRSYNYRLSLGSDGTTGYGFNLGLDTNSNGIVLSTSHTYGVGFGFNFGYGNVGLAVSSTLTGPTAGATMNVTLASNQGIFISNGTTSNQIDIQYGPNQLTLTNVASRLALDLGIGSTLPNATTTLDLQSTTKGVGLPVVTTKPSATDRKGNFLYDTDDSLKYSDGFNWRTLATVSASTAVAVAYVLYNSVNAASSDMSVSVKGDGSILLPYCSLHYALTTMINNNDTKSIIVMDSGEVESLPTTASYSWDKSITLNYGVYIIASNGNVTSAGQTTNPVTYLFNADDGFSLNGGGTMALWNKGLVNIAGGSSVSCVIDGVTILFNQRLINKTNNSLLDIDKTNFYHTDSLAIISGSPYLAYLVSTYCDLGYINTNYARLNLTRCVFNNTVLTVSTVGGYGKVTDSSFYAAANIQFSYITFSSIDSLGYNYTSRNNSFDLINNVNRTAFKVLANNCASVGDRIVRCSSGVADMIGDELPTPGSSTTKLYCYSLYTPTTVHNGVPDSTTTFIVTAVGLTIA